MLDLEQELAAITDALAGAKIDYALCGGMAMAVHGDLRTTIDVDLLVRPEDIERAAKIDRVPGGSLLLDLHVVTPPLEMAWQSRARHEWRGMRLDVVPPEALQRIRSGSRGLQTPAEPCTKSPVDYSAPAITERIRQASQLRKLCLSLAKAKPVAPSQQRKA